MYFDIIYVMFVVIIFLILSNIYRKRKLDVSDKKFNKKRNSHNFFINTGINYLFMCISILIKSYVLLIVTVIILFILMAYHLYIAIKYR
jgi:hypothetical protein